MHTLNEYWLLILSFFFVIFFLHRNCIGVSERILICRQQGFLWELQFFVFFRASFKNISIYFLERKELWSIMLYGTNSQKIILSMN